MKSVLRDVVDALKDMEVESNRGDAAGEEGNLKNRRCRRYACCVD